MRRSLTLGAPELPPRIVSPGSLLQHVSRVRYRGHSLYFGKDGINRYDDPEQDYGVLYLGFELATILMESVFRRHRWTRTKRRAITRSEVDQRIVRVIGVLEELCLADLSAPDVVASQFGLNLSQLAGRRYGNTQRISAVIHAMHDSSGQPMFDGLVYPSRNNPSGGCVALFERAAPKIDWVVDIDLAYHVDWPNFLAKFKIQILTR